MSHTLIYQIWALCSLVTFILFMYTVRKGYYTGGNLPSEWEYDDLIWVVLGCIGFPLLWALFIIPEHWGYWSKALASIWRFLAKERKFKNKEKPKKDKVTYEKLFDNMSDSLDTLFKKHGLRYRYEEEWDDQLDNYMTELEKEVRMLRLGGNKEK